MTLDLGKLWWGTIAGPQSFVSRVAEIVKAGEIPLLLSSTVIPWPGELLAAIGERLSGGSPLPISKVTITLDAREFPPGTNITDCLRRKLAELGEIDGPEWHLVWVKNIRECDIGRWVNFRENVNVREAVDKCHLVFELAPSRAHISEEEVETCRPLDIGHHVSLDDVRAFNAMAIASSGLRLPQPWRQFATEAAARLCGTDAELSADIAINGKWQTMDPRTILLLGSGGRPRPIDDELNVRLWAAQLQVLFPIIEMKRIWLIGAIRTKLLTVLAVKPCPAVQFGKPVTEPEELELTSLINLLERGLISLPSEYAFKDLVMWRLCRNSLAHHEVCRLQDVQGILDGAVAAAWDC